MGDWGGGGYGDRATINGASNDGTSNSRMRCRSRCRRVACRGNAWCGAPVVNVVVAGRLCGKLVKGQAGGRFGDHSLLPVG